MKFFFCAQTRLLSKELCHVTSPKRGGSVRCRWIYDGAEEVGYDLYRFPENMREKCGFGTGIVTIQELLY